MGGTDCSGRGEGIFKEPLKALENPNKLHVYVRVAGPVPVFHILTAAEIQKEVYRLYNREGKGQVTRRVKDSYHCAFNDADLAPYMGAWDKVRRALGAQPHRRPPRRRIENCEPNPHAETRTEGVKSPRVHTRGATA
jgi:hypothetical protein